MSRHRFVRNLDLDEEMAEEEEEEGMTTEQQAQLGLSLSIARPLLADLKPPIPDDKIMESLWYYYFDVEKTVNYLKGQRAKGIITPDRPPGKRPSPPSAATPAQQSNGTPPPSSATPQPPMSALQKLALARKNAAASSSTHSAPKSADTPTNAASPAKPMSKLAQLAASRRAAMAASESASAATLPISAANVASTTPVNGTAEVGTGQAEGAGKPLSKLAQRVAAAKAAKAAAEQRGKSSSSSSKPLLVQAPVEAPAGTSFVPSAAEPVVEDAPAGGQAMEVDQPEQEAVADTISPLFGFSSDLKTELPKLPQSPTFPACQPTTKPSIFFSLLTARPKDTPTAPPSEKDVDMDRDRGRLAFDGPSPDDVVLKARERTRLAGTGK